MTTLFRRAGVVFVAMLLLPAAAWAQRPINEHNVVPAPNVQDKGEITTVNFDFKDPRMLELDIPGRGRVVVWYMCYWVSNYGKQPFTVHPEFLLLSNRRTLHRDEVLPEVFEEVRKVEDRTNRFNFKNSVTISETPVPVSKPDALPTRVAGIAIWQIWTVAPGKKLSEEQIQFEAKARAMASFRVFVNGLSNGWSIDDDGQISRKVLMLDFDRRGDGSKVDSNEIEYRDIAKWIYRNSSSKDVDLPPPPSAKPPAADPAKPATPPPAPPVDK